jgi:hypothetical protein
MAERTPAGSGRTRRSGFARRLAAVAGGAVTVGLALGFTIVVATKLAQKPPEPRSTEAWGTITDINGSAMIISSDGTNQPPYAPITVVLSPSTRFTVHAAGALPDVQRGDNVLVMGATTGAVVVAQDIVDGGTAFADDQRGLRSTPPPPPEAPGRIPPSEGTGPMTPPVAGVVSAVHGSSFTLSKPDGSTVTVDARAAAVTVLKVGSDDVLDVGDVVGVVGMTGPNDTIAASSLHTRSP